MLDRIKKKQWDGFKEFVENMEVTSSAQRPAILMNGILEDPRFMRWVTKNLRGFHDFLQLPGDEIEQVLKSNESVMDVFAKAVEIRSEEEMVNLSRQLPRIFGKLKDALEFAKETSPAERESAQFFLLKTVRKMQRQEALNGFRWELPPPEVFHERPAIKEGILQILFEDGKLAAEGEVLKGKRIGPWKHFYDDGKLFAEGPYLDGLKHGAWMFYYGQGTPRSEGKFLADVRQGIWQEWDRNGNVGEVEWHDGKRKKA